VELLMHLIDAGFVDQLIIANDTSGYALGWPTPIHPYAHLLRYYVPKLRQGGATEKHIETLLVDNPRRVLPIQAAVPAHV